MTEGKIIGGDSLRYPYRAAKHKMKAILTKQRKRISSVRLRFLGNWLSTGTGATMDQMAIALITVNPQMEI